MLSGTEDGCDPFYTQRHIYTHARNIPSKLELSNVPFRSAKGAGPLSRDRDREHAADKMGAAFEGAGESTKGAAKKLAGWSKSSREKACDDCTYELCRNLA